MGGTTASNPWRKLRLNEGGSALTQMALQPQRAKTNRSANVASKQSKNVKPPVKAESAMNNPQMFSTQILSGEDEPQPILVTGGLERARTFREEKKLAPQGMQNSAVHLSPSERDIVYDGLKDLPLEQNLDAGASIASVGIPAHIMKDSSVGVI